ncbi:hypothetical protein QJQ45_009540 [Haematococcus lacustris]|nr:hypothetical protein QJQ45_009540 [Haematococcus lacustris]
MAVHPGLLISTTPYSTADAVALCSQCSMEACLEAEQAAEPSQPTKGKGKAKGKAAEAKPAPQPGRDCNAALNMQRIGEAKWRPLELCYWPDQGALPAKGKEYPGLGYKRLRDKPPKAQQQQQQQQPAAAHGLADMWAFQTDPATQMGMGLDPGAIQAVSAALGVWDEDGCLKSFHRSKLTRSQVQHDSGLTQARRNTQWWNDNVKLEWQHLAAATQAGTSLVAILWGEYMHPKWAEQRMRLYGAQEKVLEHYFKMLEEDAAMVSQQRWGTRKQLVVFFGNAGIGTAGGWGAKAVLQACRKMVERPNRGRPTDRLPGKVVTVDEFLTSRSAWNKRFEAPVRGLMWCPQLDQATPGDLGKWVDRDCNAALNIQRAGEAKWRPLSLCGWQHRGRLPAQGKEYHALGFKKLRDRAPRPKPNSLRCLRAGAAADPPAAAVRPFGRLRAPPSSVVAASSLASLTEEQLVLQPISTISGTVKLPGSKSLSNRILLLAALAEGTTLVKNLLSLSSHLPGCGAALALAALPLPVPLAGWLVLAACSASVRLLRLAGRGVLGPGSEAAGRVAAWLLPGMGSSLISPASKKRGAVFFLATWLFPEIHELMKVVTVAEQLLRLEWVSLSEQDSDDIRYMVGALKALGVQLEERWDRGEMLVQGCGGRFPAGGAELYLGNAGTAMRPLTAAVAAAGRGRFVLDGVARMRERPIQDLVDGLVQLGVDARCSLGTGCPPVEVQAQGLPSGKVLLSGSVSSQYLTALLMAAPLATGTEGIEVIIKDELVSQPYVDMTVKIMERFGVVVNKLDGLQHMHIPPNQTYKSPGKSHATAETKGAGSGQPPPRVVGEAYVEGDASSASYFLAGATITGGTVVVEGCGSESLQGDVRFAKVMEMLGAEVEWSPYSIKITGPTAFGRPIQAIDHDCNDIPDAAMTLAVAALFANGTTAIRNVYNWRVKETERMVAVVSELRKLGAQVEEGRDYCVITPPAQIKSTDIDTYDDHRMAMAFSLAACGGVPITINDPGCTRKTFPTYFSVLESVVQH